MNEHDFKELVARHAVVLRNAALFMTRNSSRAKDLLQDTLVKALSNPDKFTKGSNMEAWLHAIMKNTFYNDTRRLGIIRKAMDSSEELPVERLNFLSGRNQGEDGMIGRDIRKALHQLPAQFALAFSMYTGGYKYHEIAKACDAPIGTVKTRIHLARKLLRQALSEYDLAGPAANTLVE